MLDKERTNNKVVDITAWIGVVGVTALAFFCSYYFDYATPIKIILWIFWLIITLGLAYLTSTGQVVFAFAKEAKVELQRVVWPTRKETTQITLVVMAMVVATGMLLWGADTLMMWMIAKITHLG